MIHHLFARGAHVIWARGTSCLTGLNQFVGEMLGTYARRLLPLVHASPVLSPLSLFLLLARLRRNQHPRRGRFCAGPGWHLDPASPLLHLSLTSQVTNTAHSRRASDSSDRGEAEARKPRRPGGHHSPGSEGSWDPQGRRGSCRESLVTWPLSAA